MKEIKLDPKQIVEKRFKNAVHGYNGKDVDAFLDEVIQDYEAFAANIEELKNKNRELTEKLEQAPAQPKVVQQRSVEPEPALTQEATSETSAPGTTNYDILKRLSNLERHVFGQSVEPRTTNNYASTNTTTAQQPIIHSSEQLRDQNN